MDTALALSEKQIAELKQAFLLFDNNKQGVISSKELRLVIESLGVPITELQILNMLEELGVHTQSLDFPEFLAVFTDWEMKERNKIQEYTTTFELIDRSGKGFVTVEELRKFLVSVGESMPDTDFEKFLKDSEIVNQDNVITRESFLSVFQ
eukprot:TRINITY_DN9843_c0_g1_i1.p1 TRINITY_DN9843_c0_g1~~TRINITY_DN9843_c0_g1_i1.p1  ORF type:complete len:160 (-),score=32.94 TRINITY_DN9843_c0_g1_i1:3-455(-)